MWDKITNSLHITYITYTSIGRQSNRKYAEN